MSKPIALAMVSLVACDQGAKPEPTKKIVEVPAPPRDASIPTIDAGIVRPTPAMPGVRLVIKERAEDPEAECAKKTLVMQLVDRKKNVIDELEETSTCTGACDAKAKREAEQEVARLQHEIDSKPNEVSPSVLDYNFTGCLETGVRDYKIVRNLGSRDVALISEQYTGPHDWLDIRYKLALEVCGKVYLSDTFAEVMAHSWKVDDLRVRGESDGVIVVDGVGSDAEHSGTLLRLMLPVCPGTPLAEKNEDIYPY